ncbi:MAG: helix-turn-helix domain-containing protein [Thomasclavelia sp.]
MIDRKISKTKIQLVIGVIMNIITKIDKEEVVNFGTLVKIALYLDCEIDEMFLNLKIK